MLPGCPLLNGNNALAATLARSYARCGDCLVLKRLRATVLFGADVGLHGSALWQLSASAA